MGGRPVQESRSKSSEDECVERDQQNLISVTNINGFHSACVLMHFHPICLKAMANQRSQRAH